MNKNLVIALLVGGVVAIGAGGYLVMNSRDDSTSDTSTTPTQQPEAMEEESGSTDRSISDLMNLSNSLTCTYTDNQTGSEGTVYVADGRFRGDFTVNTEDMTYNSHMLSVDNTAYIWSDDQEQGVQFSVENMAEVNADEQAPNSIDVSEKYDFQCDSWSVDESMFDIPDGVDFIDYSEFAMPESMSGTQAPVEGSADQCAACESLSGEAKNQCLRALNCE